MLTINLLLCLAGFQGMIPSKCCAQIDLSNSSAIVFNCVALWSNISFAITNGT